jgi:hypothetical protein
MRNTAAEVIDVVDIDKREVNNVAMEPAEKMANKLVVGLALVVFALIVSLVFEEFRHGKFGFAIWIIGAVFGAIALGLRKAIRR